MFIKAIHAGATEKTDAAAFEQKSRKVIRNSVWKLKLPLLSEGLKG